MVGLSTAWYLQEHGVQVTVVERSGVAAGSSWGNAGWISPGLCVPLSDPSVIKYGVKALLDPDSPSTSRSSLTSAWPGSCWASPPAVPLGSGRRRWTSSCPSTAGPSRRTTSWRRTGSPHDRTRHRSWRPSAARRTPPVSSTRWN
ncbi:FAD-dependent oxidoreductase [Branchiibius cervicis]|uniref:FAD-dependent oxidoreductase n=1 Tax=Branchiibius cervicis TaxID=908252 RepID=A0ABW2APC7_9MICO